MLLTYGLLDNVRADKGKEAVLVTFVQYLLAHLRLHQDRDPVHLVKSVHNTPVERPWKEVNGRISTPLKQELNRLTRQELIDVKGDPVDKFCVSEVLIRIVNLRIQHHLTTTRKRRVPGVRGCRPDLAMTHLLQSTPLQPDQIPTTDEAVELYEEESGRPLSRRTETGFDPLEDHPQLKVRNNCLTL